MTSITQTAIEYALKQVENLDCDNVTAKCRLSRAKGALQLAQRLEPSERLTEAIKRIDAKWPTNVDDFDYGEPDEPFDQYEFH